MASRLRLHVRIAESMEVHLGDEAVNHAAVLAHHYSQGAMLSGTEKMLFYSRLAGEQALENFAYEEALEHFERALAVSQDLSMDLQQAQMLHGLGRAQVATLPRNRVGQAIATLTRAFDFFVESGDLNRAVAVASIPIEGFGFGHRTGIGSNIERALALVEPDSLHAGLLLSRRGRVMGMEEGNFEAAEDNFGQALKIARELGDAPLELWTLTVAANVEFFHLRARDTLDNASRAIELAVVAQDLKTEVTARFWAAAAMWTMGDLPRLQIQAEAMLEGAERLRDRYWLASTLWRNETVCILKGDWKSAREFNTRGLEVSDLDQRLISTRILLEFHSGNIEEGTGFIDTALEIAGAGQFRPTPGLGYTAMVIALVNRVAGGTVRRVEAEEIAKMIISSSTATPRVKSYARVAQGLNAAEANDKETAGEVYESLLPILAESPIQYMSIERLLGILRLTMGDVDGAINHFEDAISFCRNGGFRPELAWTCRDYAEALIQRGDDHGLSRKLVAQALEISIELDMPPLTDQLEAIQERIATETPNSPDYPDNLTLREVEVLRLVAVGNTDREIGDELFISFRTVGNHVRSILNKTGAANRTEAASYATLHGLTAARG